MQTVRALLSSAPGHRKFLVAVAGLVVHVAAQRYGQDSQATLDVIALLTALGVYQVRNT